MKRQINNTLLELITGIIISAAVVEVLSILVAGFSWKFTSGLWIGAATAIGLAAHMYRTGAGDWTGSTYVSLDRSCAGYAAG